MSAIKVGPQVVLNIFEHANFYHSGYREAVYGPYKGTQGFTHDKASGLSIVKKAISTCLFMHHGYGSQGGNTQCFPHGQGAQRVRYYPNLHPMGWGDNISSLIVPGGVQVKLFEHPDFLGSFFPYTGPNSFDVIHNDWYSSMMVCRGVCPWAYVRKWL